MSYFPIFIELSGQDCLLVGGGAVALRKAEKLLPYGPKLTVVAPRFAEGFYRLAATHPDTVTLLERGYRPGDEAGRRLVLAATDDAALNHAVSAACAAAGLPANVADDAAACGFLFPALLQKGPLSVGISTAGASPTAAVWLKNEIDALLPDRFAEILHFLEESRPTVKAAGPEGEADRAALFAALFEASRDAGRPLTDAELQAVLGGERAPKIGFVSLVGAGCGKADWLTVAGLKRLRRCDAVVYDDLIDTALLDELPAHAERIFVGKRSGQPSTPQREINEILLRQASLGQAVVRLKGGDPFVFGRGGEEAAALQKAGIPFEVIPGISSAIAIPGAAGIPVTRRGMSRSFHVITGHTADGGCLLSESYETLAALHGTLVFLMALAHLKTIADGLQAAGKPGNTPAAVISGGNAAHPMTVRAPLSEIAEAARAVEAPAVFVVGEVAALTLC